MGFAYTYTHAHDEPSDMTNQPQQYFSFINWPEEKEPATWQTHISHRDFQQDRAETSQSEPRVQMFSTQTNGNRQDTCGYNLT